MEPRAVDKVIEDLKQVIKDAEELLRTAADRASSEFDAAKAKAKNADKCVRRNPWASVGVAASVAFLLGFLVGRRE
jgi:ElaB/YqjD/DUF883 family membrane-anchored ribosome-binding protein